MSSSAAYLDFSASRRERSTTARASMTFETQFRREFAERYEPLAQYLARLTGDPAAAADIAQETFVRLFGRGSMPDQPRAWLVAVAHNLLRNERTQSARRHQLLDRHGAEIIPSSGSQPADALLDEAERRQHVHRALESLPERDRQMLLLRYDGFSYREIAQALRINETSVGTLLARAKTAFRLALGGSARDTEESDA